MIVALPVCRPDLSDFERGFFFFRECQLTLLTFPSFARAKGRLAL